MDKFVPICDYMYVFEDNERYMRDFLGTHLDHGTSFDLKIFLCLMDYFSTETKGINDHAYPLFTSCNYAFRQHHPEVCGHQPRLSID